MDSRLITPHTDMTYNSVRYFISDNLLVTINHYRSQIYITRIYTKTKEHPTSQSNAPPFAFSYCTSQWWPTNINLIAPCCCCCSGHNSGLSAIPVLLSTPRALRRCKQLSQLSEHLCILLGGLIVGFSFTAKC